MPRGFDASVQEVCYVIRKTAFINARLLDPASGRDEYGSLVVEDRIITAVGANAAVPEAAEKVDCNGACLTPGLIDMRAFLGEPGYEHKETLATAGRGRAAPLYCL